VLCASCCLLGATFAGADETRTENLRQYGLCVGTAFQIQDDILDIVGQESTVGKTLGIDVQKGKLTLPIIHFLRNAPQEHRVLLRSLLKSNDEDKTERIRNLIIPSPSVQYASARAKMLIDRARGAIATLPESPARQILDTLAEFVISRPM
jgi:geranylgeranyl pyrophosphate synthase